MAADSPSNCGTLVALANALGPGLFVLLFVALAIILCTFLYLIFLYALRNATVWVTWEKGKFRFVKLEREQIANIDESPESPKPPAAPEPKVRMPRKRKQDP